MEASTKKGEQVYRSSLETFPGKIEGPMGKDGRPAFTIYPHKAINAWMDAPDVLNV